MTRAVTLRFCYHKTLEQTYMEGMGMVFFWKKRGNIQQMLAGYFEQCDRCFQLFESAFATSGVSI